MKRCVIACSKVWLPSIAADVTTRTGWECSLITRPEDIAVEALLLIDPEIVCFPHWSWRIPAEVHRRWECIVFHMTDVPYGRGGSPLQNLIVRGHRDTRISALRCVEEMDAGPVYLKRALSLQGSAQDIYVQASTIIREMIVEILTHRPTPVAQAGEPVTFSRRTPEQGDIKALRTVEEVYNYIRMLDADGYPRAFLETPHLRIEFNRASLRGGHIAAEVTITAKHHDG
jgi:methionyl-tRNA formyltransferase